MKKIILIITIFILAIGCSSKNETKILDLNLAANKISQLAFKDKDFTFTDKESLDNKEAFEVYGVDTSLFTEYKSYLGTRVVDPSMYLIVKVNEDSKSVLKYQLNDMFQKYYNAYNSYYPEQAKMIENRLEKELNGYLIYIISYDNNAVYQAIQDSLK